MAIPIVTSLPDIVVEALQEAALLGGEKPRLYIDDTREAVDK